MKYKLHLLMSLLLSVSLTGYGQPDKNLQARGKLFIMGGGERSVVDGKKITVTGDGQVIKLTSSQQRKMQAKPNEMVKMKNVRLDILTAGDVFMLK